MVVGYGVLDLAEVAQHQRPSPMWAAIEQGPSPIEQTAPAPAARSESSHLHEEHQLVARRC